MEPFNLHNQKIDSGFKAPANYFDNLEDLILAKTVQNLQKPVKKLWVKQLWFYNSVAACLFLSFGLIYYLNDNQSPIDKNYLETYLISNTTSAEIYQNFTDEDINELTKTIINKNEISEYVMVDFEYYSHTENE